jgi:hypothetical protein
MPVESMPVHGPDSGLVPGEIFDAELFGLVEQALARLRRELLQHAPAVADLVLDWIASQSLTNRPADCFRDLRAHIVLFPWLIENSLCVAPANPDRDMGFHADVVYSSVNAYYYVRLLDNVMDRHHPEQADLLPMLGFFHCAFQSAWTPYFPPSHPFWDLFRSVWFGMAEATVRSTRLSEFHAPDFVETGVRKISGIKIPMAAVCLWHGRRDALDGWMRMFDAYACSNEMLDGLFDWHQDLGTKIDTYLLSEAMRRKRPGESVAGWLVREGLAWGYANVGEWIAQAQAAGRDLNCPVLMAFLNHRKAHAESLWQSIEPDLAGLTRLASLLEPATLEPDSLENDAPGPD